MTHAGRFALLSTAAFALSGLVGAAGVRVNSTASFPVGLYRQTGEWAGKGSLVAFCPLTAAVFDEALARGHIGPIHVLANMAT
jgi:type IV secretory pathway protease TraF